MVCRTRLILEQTGLTCYCRSQGLLSLFCKRRCVCWGGGGAVFAWEEHLPDSETQQALPPPPPLRVNTWPGYRNCAEKVRDQEGVESGVV